LPLTILRIDDLPTPRWAAEHEAFAGRDAERDAVDDRQPRATVQVQGEGLGEAFDPQQFVGGKRAHATSTEETRSCV
jgi:hypothetical protein